MKTDVVQVGVQAVLPTQQGSAVFLGNSEKTFIIYVDNAVGQAILAIINGIKRARPLTHDLINMIFEAFGVKIERVIVNDLKNDTYYARLILSAENELLERKLVELDARPSDCIALACQQGAPIYVSRNVWDVVSDMSPILHKISEKQQDPSSSQEQEFEMEENPDPESESDEDQSSEGDKP